MPPKYQQDLGEQLKQYQPLVKRIASRIGSKLPANVMLDDLIQEGMTGLLDALQRYVPQQNQSFEAYASMRIRVRCSLREWAGHSFAIRRSTYQRARQGSGHRQDIYRHISHRSSHPHDHGEACEVRCMACRGTI